jgi:hypothetical protein
MHAAIGGCKGLAGFLDNGQGIHIASEHDDRSGLLVLARAIALSGRGRTGTDQANDAGTVDERGMGDVHLVQTCLDIGRRLRKIVTELRHLVQIVSPRSELVCKSPSFCDKTVTDSGLRRCGSLRRWLRLKIGQS